MTKTYKTRSRTIKAIDGIDLEIGNGMFGLLGPNGAGKTTSTLHLAEGIQYRLVGPGVGDYPSAQPTRPGLEYGYVWLMKSAGQTVELL